MKSIDLKDWILFGEGGNGKTYRPADNSEEILLKVNKGKGATLEQVKWEFESSNAVRRLGIDTPALYEIVQVGKKYGILFQRVKGKKSISRICADNPERIEEAAALLSKKGRELHSTECTDPMFRPISETARKGLEAFRLFLNKDQYNVVKRWIDELPQTQSCLHGDFNPGNLIVAGEEIYWIDLGRFSYGDPMMDIAHLYLFCVVMSHTFIVQNLAHMTERQLKDFWKAFLKAEGLSSAEEIAQYERNIRKFYVLDWMVRQGFKKSTLLALLTAHSFKKIINELQ